MNESDRMGPWLRTRDIERRLPVEFVAMPHDVRSKPRREGDVEGSQTVGIVGWRVEQRWWWKALWLMRDVYLLQHDLLSGRRERAALPEETAAVDSPRNTSAVFGMEVFNKLPDSEAISP